MLTALTPAESGERERVLVVDGAKARSRSRLTNRRAERAHDGVDRKERAVLVQVIEIDDVRLELRRAHVWRERTARQDGDAAKCAVGEQQAETLASDETRP